MAMNRQQRRLAAKNGTEALRKAAHATDASIENRIRQIESELRVATEHSFMGLMYCCFALVLRKVCNYGPLRTLRVLGEVSAIVNDLQDGTIDMSKYKCWASIDGVCHNVYGLGTRCNGYSKDCKLRPAYRNLQVAAEGAARSMRKAFGIKGDFE